MAHALTEKENFKLLLSGQQPEWVPILSPGPGKASPLATVYPELLSTSITKPGKVTDILGVTYVPVADVGGAKIPEPNNFILKDIRQWRDVIKVPDISGIDWEAMAKKDYVTFHVDPEKSVVNLATHFGFFQYLMAFMGFSEGLCAIVEEPEEVRALSEYLCDFFLQVLEACADYYHPEMLYLCDDIAAWKGPFVSPETYREIFKPVMARQAKFAQDRGLLISMHCCGRCEELIDDWRDFGVNIWTSAQTSNDLPAIKKKYGNDFIIGGGWDGREELLRPDVSEEVVKNSVYRSFEMLAPGGGYAFAGGFLGLPTDEATKRKNQWVREAAEECSQSFYKK